MLDNECDFLPRTKVARMVPRTTPSDPCGNFSKADREVEIRQQTPSGGPLEAADYVASAAADLAVMAHRHGLNTLGFLLEMARMEAEEVGRQQRINAIR
jgi:hypothetical protein